MANKLRSPKKYPYPTSNPPPPPPPPPPHASSVCINGVWAVRVNALIVKACQKETNTNLLYGLKRLKTENQ